MEIKTIEAKIRPSAKLITAIGEDLIGDPYAAIIELVKNSFDADAEKVEIEFDFDSRINSLIIKIQDDGTGMTFDTVINKWLVPATRNKLENKYSIKKNRPVQGRKGIGRFAASILGEELLISTIDSSGSKTEILIDWDIFNSKDFLDEIDLLVTNTETTKKQGTLIRINATKEKYLQWGQTQLEKLENELKKLKSPLKNNEDFNIYINYKNSPFEEFEGKIKIEEIEITKIFDYRISGVISEDGSISALYENNVEPNLPKDNIEISFFDKNDWSGGNILFDLCVYDKDPESLSNLSKKAHSYLSVDIKKSEIKDLLKDISGVNIYRNNFRIRPYGEKGVDWLNLDNRRIQNPSVRVGNDQIIGYVYIESEELSHLEEKSARDGLKENKNYWDLHSVIKKILSELEDRRRKYRKINSDLKLSKSVQKDMKNLFDFKDLNYKVRTTLSSLNVGEETIKEVINIIEKEEDKKSKILENIQNTIALYQGQATLGKIVTVFLHEGRKPVNFFRQESIFINKMIKLYKDNNDDDIYNDILETSNNFRIHSNMLSKLFKRLDPLAITRRSYKKDFSIHKTIEKSINIFETELKENNISVLIECIPELTFWGWEEDLIIALANLIENSIYWLSFNTSILKQISFEIEESENSIIVKYKDTGSGISKDLVESQDIFEPGFTKKIDGMGLGLPIAGEAIERLNGTIMALYKENGAYFKIELER